MNAVFGISGGWPKEMANALLVLHVHLEFQQHDAPARMISRPRLNSPDSM